MKRDPGSSEVVDKSLELTKFLLALGRVERTIHHEDGKTVETDAEHTVMLGVMACAFAKEFLPELDRGKIAELALVHDLVEVYAGDTSTFKTLSEAEKADKTARESAALVRIKQEFDGIFPWVSETIEAYERLESPESRFVKFFDKALPKLTHILNKGTMVRKLGHTKESAYAVHTTQIASIMSGYGKDYPQVEAFYRAVIELLQRECFD
jgi:5'-deoxynucleotidase YfbR-like HD superfamily hydrolase